MYALAQEADAAYDGARTRVARFVGWEPRTTIFTKNVTEAINLVAYAWGRANVGAGDAVLITQMEHHANIVPWQRSAASAARSCATWRWTSAASCRSSSSTASSRRGDVKLVAFTHVSNVLGTINPVAEMTARVRAAGAVSLVDGAQAVPHMPVDVERSAPTSTPGRATRRSGRRASACCTARAELLEEMQPFLTGGDMISSVTSTAPPGTSCRTSSRRARPPIAEAVGLGAAVDYLDALGMERVRAHEHELTGYLLERLREVDGCASSARRGRESRRGHVVHDRGHARRTTSPSWPTAAACASAPGTTARSR